MPLEILIIRLSALGDVVHTLPVAAAIKRYNPEAKVTWVVDPLSAPLLKNNPAIDRVIVFPGKNLFPKKRHTNVSPQMVASDSAPLGLVLSDVKSAELDSQSKVNPVKLLNDFWREFKSHKYDIAIDAQGLFKSAALAWLSGAKIRLGFADTREFADQFLTHKVDVGNFFGPDKHIVDLYIQLVVKLFEIIGTNIPSTWLTAQFLLPPIPPDIKEKTTSWLSIYKNAKKETQNIVLIPGTTWDSKIWPIQNWEQLGKLLLFNNNCQIIICGGSAEITANKQLEDFLVTVEKRSVINLTGRTSLLDLISIFDQSAIVIGADSGPLHLAAAVNKPKVVGVMGSTPRKRNGPYGKNGLTVALDLECQPCFQKKCPLGTRACLNDLSAQSVYDQVMNFVDN